MQLLSSRPILAAALGAALLLSTQARAGIELPPVEDPQVLEWAGKASGDLDRYLADPKGTFAMPAEGKSFPCEVTPEVMSRIVGVRLPGVPMPEDERKAWAKQLRGQPGAKPMENTDVTIRLVQADCKDGKPAGVVKGWVEHTMSMANATYTSNYRWRKYFEATVAPDGTREGVAMQRMLQLSSELKWADPQMAATMAKNPSLPTDSASFIYTLATPDKSSKSVKVTRIAVGGPAPMTTVSTDVSLPQGPNRWKMVSYEGKKPMWEVPFRNGRQHGKQVTYARVFAGVQVPETMICWDDGEQIKTTQCDVD